MKSSSIHDEDYTLSPVPLSARLSLIATVLVWSSLTLDPSAPYLAMWWASIHTLASLAIAILIANTVLSISSSISGYIASKTGLTYALSTGNTYGIKGSLVPSLCSGFVAVGWLAFSIGVVADTLVATLNLPVWMYYFVVPMLIAIFSITAFKGIKHILKLAKIGVPLLIALIVLSIILSIRIYGPPPLGIVDFNHLPLLISLVIGTFVNGSIVLSFDYQRFCKRALDSIITAFTNFLGFWSFIILLTAIPATLTGRDLISTLRILGLGPLAAISLIMLAWTSTDNQLYSASLSWTYGVNCLGVSISRRKVVIVAAILTTILALTRLHEYALQWLSLLTTISLPAGVILWTDYFISKEAWSSNSIVNIKAFISWCIGSLIIYVTLGNWYSLPLSFAITVMVYVLLKRGLR